MRNFDMHGHGRGHGHGFGGHPMVKPLVIGAVLFAALGLVVMSLWNALLPGIIGVKSIGFWQAVGLLVLCRILFGGLGFRPGMFGGRERRRMHERWMQMSPEEREQFVQQRRGGFRGHGRGHCHSRHGEHHGGHHERCGEHEHSRQKPEDGAPKPTDAE